LATSRRMSLQLLGSAYCQKEAEAQHRGGPTQADCQAIPILANNLYV
jgi:hypothetical protein